MGNRETRLGTLLKRRQHIQVQGTQFGHSKGPPGTGHHPTRPTRSTHRSPGMATLGHLQVCQLPSGDSHR